jgi:hypothetical protein
MYRAGRNAAIVVTLRLASHQWDTTMNLSAFDHALHAVRTYLVECTERKGWDDQRTAELSEIIRSCVEGIGANHRDSQASARLPLEALRHATGYVDEHLRAVDLG